MDAATMHVIFVCTGNTGRSMTAEALARAHLTALRVDHIHVASRGTNVDPSNRAPEPGFVALLAERHVDVRRHAAQQLTAPDANQADLILAMTPDHLVWIATQFPAAAAKSALLPDYAREPGAVPDAFGKPPEFCRHVLEQLLRLVPIAIDRAALFRSPRSDRPC